mmetsp:Transcript_18217/g.41375  ORF Transcript_18217/g.41375 Transcript_18217/m.41375 type:complete len:500 (-) Transcript_18217:287-1786(-)
MKITIFSMKTCPHCARAKKALEARGYEFHDISISDYPEKRSDMLSLADRLTVPQIFVNTVHVGGASELIEALGNGAFEKMVQELQHEQDPQDPRLQIPDYPPKPEAKPAELEEELLCAGTECLSYEDTVRELKNGLRITDRAYHGTVYKRCFLGSEAVSFLQTRFSLKSRLEALQVGNSFLDSNVFHHVCRDHSLKDENLFYRLQADCEPEILNNIRVWNNRVDDPLITVRECKKKFSALQSRYTDSDGLIDYAAISKDSDFWKFAESTCEFQKLDVSSLNLSQKKAFFINLYNLMVLHAFAQVGIPQTSFRRMSFFDTVGYSVGGHFFSLNDIENGILRGNKKAPFHLSPPFAKNDPRLDFALPSCENRIHFALNCGAKSCPPIKNFTSESVEEELRVVAMAFLEMEENLKVDKTLKIVYLSKILSWYGRDFGKSDVEVVQTILPWVRGSAKEDLQALISTKSFKIKFFPYDWSTNASDFIAYDPQDLKEKAPQCTII